jgi:hypothetical protein
MMAGGEDVETRRWTSSTRRRGYLAWVRVMRVWRVRLVVKGTGDAEEAIMVPLVNGRGGDNVKGAGIARDV